MPDARRSRTYAEEQVWQVRLFLGCSEFQVYANSFKYGRTHAPKQVEYVHPSQGKISWRILFINSFSSWVKSPLEDEPGDQNLDPSSATLLYVII